MNGHGMGPPEYLITRRETHDDALVTAQYVELVRVLIEALSGNRPDLAKLFSEIVAGLRQIIDQYLSPFSEEQRLYEEHFQWAKTALEKEPGLWAFFFGPSEAERLATFEQRMAIINAIHEMRLMQLQGHFVLQHSLVRDSIVYLAALSLQMMSAGAGTVTPAQAIEMLGYGNNPPVQGPVILNRPRREEASA